MVFWGGTGLDSGLTGDRVLLAASVSVALTLGSWVVGYKVVESE